MLTGGSASTATAELDDLMTSLNNFKMDADRNVDEPVIGGAPNLDDMLGNLQEDMNKQGIKTKQKGVCAACSKPIVGQVITALGHTWHPEHFTCTHCNQELGTMNFFERDGKPYCEQDYHLLFSPVCLLPGSYTGQVYISPGPDMAPRMLLVLRLWQTVW